MFSRSKAQDLASCPICGRNFSGDRIEAHQNICQRVSSKKRKVFDSLKHRLQGTDAAPYLRKISRNINKKAGSSSGATTSKNNWRIRHEEFIQAIRSAKEVQVHLARGGKLSDLPPPAPSENPDYIQCPHCSRRFNETAANRHIPKCANYDFNKPKGFMGKR